MDVAHYCEGLAVKANFFTPQNKGINMNTTALSKPVRLSTLVTVFITLTATTALWASTPTEQVKATIDQVMETLGEPKLQGANKKIERREKLRQIILPRFDFAEMAKRALGNNWNRYPEKQREFVSAFTQLLEESYADEIEMAKGEKVIYLNERTDKDFAEVDTRVISPKGEETPMTYKLHSVDSNWKVYDIVVANISIVNNYRAQFNRVLSNAPIDELINRMKEKRFQKSN